MAADGMMALSRVTLASAGLSCYFGPGNGSQRATNVVLLVLLLLVVVIALRLFHFATDRYLTSHTDW